MIKLNFKVRLGKVTLLSLILKLENRHISI